MGTTSNVPSSLLQQSVQHADGSLEEVRETILAVPMQRLATALGLDSKT